MAPLITTSIKQQNKFPVRVILWAGFIAGSLDGLAASLLYSIRTGKNPIRVFQYIASGIFGTDAFAGGVPVALIGLIIHYIIACSFANIFFWIYLRIRWLTHHWIAGGILYGLFVWLVMNGLVIPLSKVAKPPFVLTQVLLGILILIVAVGLPIAWFITTSYTKWSRTKHE